MEENEEQNSASSSASLFERVASILEQARSNVVRAVNRNMVLAYWLIGREIVEEIQGGEERAKYGKQVVERLSQQLTERYGKGFSAQTLWSFRQFYQVYADRYEILFPLGRELPEDGKNNSPGSDSPNDMLQTPETTGTTNGEILHPPDGELRVRPKSGPTGAEAVRGFSRPNICSAYPLRNNCGWKSKRSVD